MLFVGKEEFLVPSLLFEFDLRGACVCLITLGFVFFCESICKVPTVGVNVNTVCVSVIVPKQSLYLRPDRCWLPGTRSGMRFKFFFSLCVRAV